MNGGWMGRRVQPERRPPLLAVVCDEPGMRRVCRMDGQVCCCCCYLLARRRLFGWGDESSFVLRGENNLELFIRFYFYTHFLSQQSVVLAFLGVFL